MEKQLAEIVMWEQVRQDCKYPKEDNNNGLIYGLYLIDNFDEDNWCGDIRDVIVTGKHITISANCFSIVL